MAFDVVPDNTTGINYISDPSVSIVLDDEDDLIVNIGNQEVDPEGIDPNRKAHYEGVVVGHGTYGAISIGRRHW